MMTDYSKWDKFDDNEALQIVAKEQTPYTSSSYKEFKKNSKQLDNVDYERRKHLKNVAAALKSKVNL